MLLLIDKIKKMSTSFRKGYNLRSFIKNNNPQTISIILSIILTSLAYLVIEVSYSSMQSLLPLLLADKGGIFPFFFYFLRNLSFTLLAGLGFYVLYQKKSSSLVKAMPKYGWWTVIVGVLVTFFLSIILMLIGDNFCLSYSSDSAVAEFKTANVYCLIYRFCTDWIPLVGKEFLTATITLVIYNYLSKCFSYQLAIRAAAIFSAIIFGSLHFSAYQWNLYQSLIVIGLGRLPFTYLWFKTDSLRGGSYAHILYNYLLFAIITFVQ